MNELTHIDSNGNLRMVDVSDKENSIRKSKASIEVILNDTTYEMLKENKGPKGDILTVAKVAGIQAAKKTSELIPLCHQISLNQVEIIFEMDDTEKSVKVFSSVNCHGNTGVEMEALTACSITALTIYDMLKAVQKNIKINNLILIEKTGGKSGDYKNRSI